MGKTLPDKLNGALRRAISTCDERKVVELLDAGADVNGLDNYGLSMLMRAARKGYADICELLIKRGARVDAVDRRSRPPLHHAAAFNRSDAVRRLAKFGATLDWKDCHGWNAYKLAESQHYYETCRALLDSGAQENPPDPKSMSIGSIQGVGVSKGVEQAIRFLSSELSDHSASNPWHEKGHLNIGVFVESGIFKPDHFGIRRETFSRKRRYAVVGIGMRNLESEQQAIEQIVRAMIEGLKIAAPLFKKAEIPFESEHEKMMIGKIARSRKVGHLLQAFEY